MVGGGPVKGRGVQGHHDDDVHCHHRCGWRSWLVVGGGMVEGVGVVKNCHDDDDGMHCRHGQK